MSSSANVRGTSARSRVQIPALHVETRLMRLAVPYNSATAAKAARVVAERDSVLEVKKAAAAAEKAAREVAPGGAQGERRPRRAPRRCRTPVRQAFNCRPPARRCRQARVRITSARCLTQRLEQLSAGHTG